MVAMTLPVDGLQTDEVRQKLTDAYCWGEEPEAWVNAEAIANTINVAPTHSNLTSIGSAIRQFGVRTRKTNKGRFVLVPKAKIK